jgi:hypothetical protein
VFVHGFGCNAGMIECLVRAELLVEVEVRPQMTMMVIRAMVVMTMHHLRTRIEIVRMRMAMMDGITRKCRRGQHGNRKNCSGQSLQHDLLLIDRDHEDDRSDGRARRSCRNRSGGALNRG